MSLNQLMNQESLLFKVQQNLYGYLPGQWRNRKQVFLMHLKKFFASSDSHTDITTHKANLLDHCFCHLEHQKIYLLGGLIKA